jgi:phospholipid/cholesterol/gamma-HCH transport system permease protein
MHFIHGARHVLVMTGRYAILLGRVIAVLPGSRGIMRAILAQVHFIGARSLPVIAVAGVFAGMIVAVQFHDTLVRFGAKSLLGTAVGLSLIRELGPVLAALILIGRAGSATCAELAIMRTDQQLDALESMAIDPLGFLLAPRLVGFVLALPLLVACFDVFGLCGGLLVAISTFGSGYQQFMGNLVDGVHTADIVMGVVKSVAFGALGGWLCIAKGYFSDGLHGAEGVSRATTDAVVLASLAVLFADYVLSAFMQ